MHYFRAHVELCEFSFRVCYGCLSLLLPVFIAAPAGSCTVEGDVSIASLEFDKSRGLVSLERLCTSLLMSGIGPSLSQL